MRKAITEPAQDISVFAETDVLVVGGGPAGYTAAIAAARNGADVILMERYGHLGGMATGGLVLLLDCLCDGKGNVLVRGLVEETVDRLKHLDGIIAPPEDLWGSDDRAAVNLWRRWGSDGGEGKIVRYSPVVDPEMLKCVAAQMVEESGARMLLHSWMSKAYVEDNTVRGVIFESKSGRQAILAKVVVDCTGDGDVFATAGAEFNVGRLPLGLVFRVGNVDIQAAEKAIGEDPTFAKYVSDRLHELGGVRGGYSFGELPAGFYMRSSRDDVVWFNTVVPGNALNVEDLTSVEIRVRKAMLVTLDFFKKEVPGFERAYVIDTAPQVGTRASRMLLGEHVLTIDELRAGTVFEDTVCVSQPPYKGFSPDDPYKSVPYRSFLPRSIENLLVAGRCFSGDLLAVEMMRVIPSVMLMGQACGTAAAMAAEAGISPREVPVKELQMKLREQGMYLP
ncbi:MAG TPA: FAD-dependent oxidoreductase [Firmicutes bacterium]|nr:FAD-dependent oxidoreductase [Bacillota bacterium]